MEHAVQKEETLHQKIGSYNFHRTNFNQSVVMAPIVAGAGYITFGQAAYETFRPEVVSEDAIQSEMLGEAFTACIENYLPTADGQLVCNMPIEAEILETIETVQAMQSGALEDYNAQYGPYEEPVSIGIGLVLALMVGAMALGHHRGKKKLEQDVPNIKELAKQARKGIWPEEPEEPEAPEL